MADIVPLHHISRDCQQEARDTEKERDSLLPVWRSGRCASLSSLPSVLLSQSADSWLCLSVLVCGTLEFIVIKSENCSKNLPPGSAEITFP